MDATRPLVASPVHMAEAVRGPNAVRPADAEAAKLFEGMLWSQMVQGMRRTVHASGLLGDSGQARTTYDYLLDQAVIAAAMQGGKGGSISARVQEALDRRTQPRTS